MEWKNYPEQIPYYDGVINVSNPLLFLTNINGETHIRLGKYCNIGGGFIEAADPKNKVYTDFSVVKFYEIPLP